MKIKRVYLEITNACNLNCPFCSNSKGQSFMSINDINNYLTQIKEISDYVYLHVLGEPLLHKEIDEVFNKCDELSLNVQLVTNGTLLKNHLNVLNHQSLRKLSISLHSINNIDIKNDYFETIKELINKENNINIELRFYDFNNLDNDLNEFNKYLYANYDIKKTTKKNSFKLKDNVYIYYNKLFDWPNINDSFISNIGYCHGGIDQIAILNDGRVTLCCLDPLGHNTIGDLKKNSLKEILDSNTYKDIIKNFKNRKINKELCTKCSYRLRFDDMRNSKQ